MSRSVAADPISSPPRMSGLLDTATIRTSPSGRTILVS
jgi:hypothetical protein